MRSVPLPFLSKITLLWTRAREPGPVSPVKVDSPLPFPWTQRGEIYNRYFHPPDAVRRRVRLRSYAIGAILHVGLCVHMYIFPFTDWHRVLDPFGVLVFFQIHFPPTSCRCGSNCLLCFFALPPDLRKTNFTAFSYGYFTTHEHMFAIHDSAYCKL